MPVTLEVLRDHLAYTTWASKRLVDAASTLTHEELTRDFGTADRSVLGTLSHIFGADRVCLPAFRVRTFNWLSRPGLNKASHFFRAPGPPSMGSGPPGPPGSPTNAPATEITYRDFKGLEWRQPLWQIILHLVNHATHHRGQVSGFMRSLGRNPPGIDLVYYHRKQF